MRKSFFIGCQLIVIVSLLTACNSISSKKIESSNEGKTSFSKNENELLNTLPNVEGKIYKVVEEMPRFHGCENKSDKQKRKQCAQNELLKFIFKNFKYPKEAIDNNMVGKIVVQFIVDKNGTLENIKMLKDPGGVFEKEIKRVFRLMPKWIPGKHNGQPVNVELTLPINIKPE